MGQMVFRTEYLIGSASQLSNPLVFHPQTLGQPASNRTHKLPAAFWEFCEMCDQETLESLQRLFIKDDMIGFVDGEPGVIQTKAHCLERKSRVVFDPRKALFLRRGHNFAVDH